jgi:hypothetical protein
MLWAVELRLRQTEAGRALWALVERHRDAVLALVNHTRPVTVVWQRNQGPSFIAALGRSVKESNYRIPREIGGVSRKEFTLALAIILDVYGSESLRADLEQHGRLLQELLIERDTTEEMFLRREENRSLITTGSGD